MKDRDPVNMFWSGFFAGVAVSMLTINALVFILL